MGGLLAVLWAIWMDIAFTVWPAPYSFQHRFHHKIDSPILALEMARNSSDIDAVLQRNDPGNPDPDKGTKAIQALYLNTVLDCFFIPLYTGYLVLFGLAYHPGAFARSVLIGLTAATGLTDYAENVLLFGVLGGRAIPVYIVSQAKWIWLALVLSVLASLLLSRHTGPYSIATRRVLAFLHIGAALFVLLGITFAEYPWLALGAELFTFTVLINVIGLFGPVLALDPIRQVSVPDFCEKRRMKAHTGPAVREMPADAMD